MTRTVPILFSLIIVFTTSLAQKKTNSDLPQKIKEFDQYVEAARNSWSVPGLAVAVVKDNQVLFKKGYGVRELGTMDKVDTQTLFACASTTKAMTAVCMGMLVDEGKVKWDDPVIKHLPDFHVYDSYVTRDLRIRDLFIHNTGVGNADFLWTMLDISSDEILEKMELVKPSYPLRGGYIYQNIFYLAAGKVIENISGKSWDQFIKERIFTPLGMNRTFPLLKDINDVNQTKPHYFFNESIHVIENTSADVIGPAGSVWSCADDMATWMMCMLDSGKYAGGRLLKASTWTEMFKPQTIISQ
ncbi:MAG: serine hydrolase, partial [Flammeovirgaceae bacterium]|nr:serine hydrolase [Flammeovirgaceae bacterium]